MKLSQKRNSIDFDSKGQSEPLPREFSPMLASSGVEPPEGPDWLLEVKWDGYRAIAIVEHTNVRLLSRNGLSLEKKFEKVVAELERLISTRRFWTARLSQSTRMESRVSSFCSDSSASRKVL